MTINISNEYPQPQTNAEAISGSANIQVFLEFVIIFSLPIPTYFLYFFLNLLTPLADLILSPSCVENCDTARYEDSAQDMFMPHIDLLSLIWSYTPSLLNLDFSLFDLK